MKPETQPAYLTLEEASKLTSLSASTLRRRIRRKQIRVWQPGGPGTRLLIPRSELVAPVTSAASDKFFRDNDELKSKASRLSGPRPRWQRQ